MAANQQDVVPNHKVLYHIVKGPGRKNSWRRFGAGFVNTDGSMNLIIDLFPGQHFQLRDPNVEAAPEPESKKAKTRTVTIDRSKKAR